MRYEYNDDDDYGAIIVRYENITDLMGRVGPEKSSKLEILAKDPIRRFAKQMVGSTLNQIYPKRMISNSTEKSFTWGALYRWSRRMMTTYDQSNPLTLTLRLLRFISTGWVLLLASQNLKSGLTILFTANWEVWCFFLYLNLRMAHSK